MPLLQDTVFRASCLTPRDSGPCLVLELEEMAGLATGGSDFTRAALEGAGGGSKMFGQQEH